MRSDTLADTLHEVRAGLASTRERISVLVDLPDWARDRWTGRELLDEGKNEQALDALWPEIQMGCPWYLMQARYLAEARLESRLDHADASLGRLCSAAQYPHNDHWDPDLYVQALYGIATFKSSCVEIDRAKWARLCLDVVEALTWWRFGSWWSEAVEERLRQLIFDDEPKPLLLDNDPKASWQHYIADPAHAIQTFGDWQDELVGLEESLVATIAMSEFNATLSQRPFAIEIAALWREGEPARTAADVGGLLLDAYRPHEPGKGDEPGAAFDRPYWHDPLAQTQLEALLSRASVELHDPDAADAAFSRGFSGYEEVSTWIVQLSELTDARILAFLGELELAFDKLWSCVRRFNSPFGDADLALEALCELALLDRPGPRHPSPKDWAVVAQAMAEADGEWSPGPWYVPFRRGIARLAAQD